MPDSIEPVFTFEFKSGCREVKFRGTRSEFETGAFQKLLLLVIPELRPPGSCEVVAIDQLRSELGRPAGPVL